MNVERTMQFILDSQAKAEVRMAKTEERVDRMEARFDKRINAITKLIEAGMKMLAQNQKAIKDLAATQKQTEKKLGLFLDSMQKGSNGGPARRRR